jgi:hypothetical protein
MKRDCLTTSSKASASQSRNGKDRSARSKYGPLSYFSFSSSSSSSLTNEAAFARHVSESARALEVFVRHRTRSTKIAATRVRVSGSKIPERFNEQPAFDPVSGETSSRYVPGFETTLKSPIDTETPLPFSLDVRTGAPAGSNAAPDRRGFLDGGPRNSDFAASDGPGVQGDTPVHYLARRTYSLSGAPDVSAAAYGIAPPALPQPPSDDGPLTLMQAYIASGWTRANPSDLRSPPKG